MRVRTGRGKSSGGVCLNLALGLVKRTVKGADRLDAVRFS
jgi:hypothetical protein